MNSLNKLIKNLTALLLGIIIAFLIVEGVLRIYNPFGFRVKGDKISLPVNQRYVIKKDTSKNTHPKFDETIIHTKNSLGFRGKEPPADFSKYLRIITVGGSTTECTFLTDGKTWTDVLGKRLKSDFKNLWINNAGFDGQSTFGHIVLLEDYVVKLKPHLVLFLIGANDQDRQDLSDQEIEIMRNKYVFHSVKGFLKSLANHSEVFSLGLNFYRYWKSVQLGIEHTEFDFKIYKKVDINKYLTDDYLKRKKKASQKYKLNAEEFESRLQTLIDNSIDKNIAPVLITQPAFYGDFIDDVTGVNFKFTELSWAIMEVYNDVTRQVGEKNNILVIDLASELPKSSRYYYDWLHYTNEGAEKVAEIMYNNLYPYLANKYSEFFTGTDLIKNRGEHK